MITRYTSFYTGLLLGLSNLTMVLLFFLDLEGSSGRVYGGGGSG